MRRALVTLVSAAAIAGPTAAAVALAGSASAAPPGRAPLSSAVERPATAVPRVSGSFGQTPQINFPSVAPPSTLVTKVLHRGNGAVVRKGDLIAVGYTGQIWRGKIFDSTFLAKFGHEYPFTTQIGVGSVVKGWDEGLAGARVGSRVVLVIPPKWGYGSRGAPKAGITGKDTLVFVVDVLGAWGKGASSGQGAQPVTDTHAGVTVSGSLGAPPRVQVARSAAHPKRQVEVVLDRGRGTGVNGGLLVFQEYVTDWTGKVLESTWSQPYPQQQEITNTSVPDPFAGIPVGSRVLFLEPKSSQGGPYAVVVDIVADVTTR